MATAPKKKAESDRKRFTTPIFRVSFMQGLFKPQVFKGGEDEPREDGKEATPKHSVTAIWTPGEFGTILDAADEASEKAKWSAILREVKARCLEDLKKAWPEGIASDKRGIRNGMAKAGTEGYGDGTRFANLTTYQPPGVVSLQRVTDKKSGKEVYKPITAESGLMYSGCYARATIGVGTYNFKKMSKGVTLWLYNLQKVKDGDRLDNRVKPEDDFDESLDSEFMETDNGDDDDGDDNDGDDEDFG